MERERARFEFLFQTGAIRSPFKEQLIDLVGDMFLFQTGAIRRGNEYH